MGNNLNDMEWHTMYIQRRGGHMELWVDKKDSQKSKFSLKFDEDT